MVTRQTAGNALLTRELIHSGLDSGVIVERAGVWCLDGDLPLGISIAERVRDELRHLEGDREAAELLAIGEPLSLPVAERAVGADRLEALETRGLLVAEMISDSTWVRFAHPLVADVLRDDLPMLRRRRLLREMVAAIEGTASATTTERFRALDGRLELGEPIDRDALLSAARAARGMASASAERLARALVAQDDSPRAHVVLAETLILLGRTAEAWATLDEIDSPDLDAADREALLHTRALARIRLGDTQVAADMLVEPGATIPFELQAAQAHALSLAGHLNEARLIALPLVDDPRADAAPRALAACCITADGAMAGHFDEAERVFVESQRAVARAHPTLPYAPSVVRIATTISRALAGRLDAAEELAGTMYEQALRDDDDWAVTRGASGLGITALVRGQPRTATRYFRISVASLNAFDELYRCYTLSWLARGAALAGLVDEARAALADPGGAPDLAIFRPDWQLAEAAVLAASGELAAAGARALDAARLAASFGEWAVVLWAACDAVRYRNDRSGALLAVAAAARVDGELAPVLARDADARVDDDGPGLLTASEHFEQLGALLLGADSAYASAAAYARHDEAARAARALVRGTQLHARCEEASLPWQPRHHATAALTRREHQVALLAAGGRPDARIADELQISVRTVQNHLASVYGKLGISSRRQLPDALVSG